MSRFDEIDAIRAVVAMPSLARLLKPEHFACVRLRAAFEHLAAGGTVWAMEGLAREALVRDDLWCTDDAEADAVTRLVQSADWAARQYALKLALAACEEHDQEAMDRALSRLKR